MNGAYGADVPGDSDARAVVNMVTTEQRAGRYAGLTWIAEGSVIRATGRPESRSQFDEWCRDLRVSFASITFRPECATGRGHRASVPIILTAVEPWKWWNK